SDRTQSADGLGPDCVRHCADWAHDGVTSRTRPRISGGANRYLVPTWRVRRGRSYSSKGHHVNRVSVFACEAQPIVIEGLAKVLSAGEEFEYVGSASSLVEAL